MPTYEYECKSCKHNFDVFQSIKDDPLKVCPKCGKELRRIINGGNGVIFKGGGFYVTDKNGTGGKTASEKSTGEKTRDGEKPGDKPAQSKTAEAASCKGCPKSDTCPQAANS